MSTDSCKSFTVRDDSNSSRLLRHVFVTVAVVVWAVSVCAGMLFLVDYSTAPGISGDSPSIWPAKTQIKRTQNTPTMLVFLHPKCTCSRATMNRIEQLLSECERPPSLQFFFFCPSDVEPSWAHSDLWYAAKKLAHTEIVMDQDGAIAGQFGAKTSGQILVYTTNGKLAFCGGITSGRGHEGTCPGYKTLRQVVVSAKTETASHHQIRRFPVFGCPIFLSVASHSVGIKP